MAAVKTRYGALCGRIVIARLPELSSVRFEDSAVWAEIALVNSHHTRATNYKSSHYEKTVAGRT
jgi:hypothetical protein